MVNNKGYVGDLVEKDAKNLLDILKANIQVSF